MSTIWAFQDSGQPFETLEAGKFKKLLWKVGKWVHPDTGQKINATKEWLKELYENTKEYLKSGGWQAPFSDGHSYSSTSTLGWWEDFQLNEDGSISGIVDVKDPAVKDKIRNEQIKFTSPAVKFNVKDNQNNQYDKAIVHVAATAYPVMGDQEGFEELSRDQYTLACSIDGKPETVYCFIGDKDMTLLEKLADSLNLEGEDRTEEAILQTLQDLKLVQEEEKPEEEKPPEEEDKDEGEKEEKPEEKEGGDKEKAPGEEESPSESEEKSEKEKELESRLSRLEERHNKLLEKEASTEVGMAVNAGLPPAIGNILKDLLLSQEREMLCLSKDGKDVVTKKINVSLLAKDLLKELLADKQHKIDLSTISLESLTSHNEEQKQAVKQERDWQLTLAKHVKEQGAEVIWKDEKRPELGFDVKAGDFVHEDKPIT